MSVTSASPSSAMRRAWMAVLAHTPRAELEAALSQALEGASPPEFDWLRPPDTGLAMVVKDGRFGPYVTDGTTNASLRSGKSSTAGSRSYSYIRRPVAAPRESASSHSRSHSTSWQRRRTRSAG